MAYALIYAIIVDVFVELESKLDRRLKKQVTWKTNDHQIMAFKFSICSNPDLLNGPKLSSAGSRLSGRTQTVP